MHVHLNELYWWVFKSRWLYHIYVCFSSALPRARLLGAAFKTSALLGSLPNHLFVAPHLHVCDTNKVKFKGHVYSVKARAAMMASGSLESTDSDSEPPNLTGCVGEKRWRCGHGISGFNQRLM